MKATWELTVWEMIERVQGGFERAQQEALADLARRTVAAMDRFLEDGDLAACLEAFDALGGEAERRGRSEDYEAMVRTLLALESGPPS